MTAGCLRPAWRQSCADPHNEGQGQLNDDGAWQAYHAACEVPLADSGTLRPLSGTALRLLLQLMPADEASSAGGRSHSAVYALDVARPVMPSLSDTQDMSFATSL